MGALRGGRLGGKAGLGPIEGGGGVRRGEV